MNKLLVTLSFLFLLTCLSSQSWASKGRWFYTNKMNCLVWNPNPQPQEFARWSGECSNGFANGVGILTWLIEDKYIGEYQGEYKDGFMSGLGIYYFPGGNQYIGEFKYVKKDMQGNLNWLGGDKFKGEWKNNKFNGQGKYTYEDGSIEEGIWKDGKFMYKKKPTSTSNSKIEDYKSFCSEIGFTPGTEKFGECVVEAMKKG